MQPVVYDTTHLVDDPVACVCSNAPLRNLVTVAQREFVDRFMNVVLRQDLPLLTTRGRGHHRVFFSVRGMKRRTGEQTVLQALSLYLHQLRLNAPIAFSVRHMPSASMHRTRYMLWLASQILGDRCGLPTCGWHCVSRWLRFSHVRWHLTIALSCPC